jgi:hypothetical protein
LLGKNENPYLYIFKYHLNDFSSYTLWAKSLTLLRFSRALMGLDFSEVGACLKEETYFEGVIFALENYWHLCFPSKFLFVLLLLSGYRSTMF